MKILVSDEASQSNASAGHDQKHLNVPSTTGASMVTPQFQPISIPQTPVSTAFNHTPAVSGNRKIHPAKIELQHALLNIHNLSATPRPTDTENLLHSERNLHPTDSLASLTNSLGSKHGGKSYFPSRNKSLQNVPRAISYINSSINSLDTTKGMSS